MNHKASAKTLGLVQLALLGALIFILAFTPFLGYIPLGVTRATIVHIPVIIGSLLLGPKKGAVLGFLFGVTSFLQNSFISPNITSFTFTPLYSVGDFHGNGWSLVICFVPRILVGVVPYYAYKLFMRWLEARKGGQTASLAIAGLLGSLTNTLLVMNLIYFCFGQQYAAAKEVATGLYGVILSVILINGVPEAIVAAILTAAICKALFRFTKKNRL
ncbi:MAG TPA: ECF transporter S component [Candidatus Merdivicinus faecavium]|nr:ECF transporter S component [Candidatus Merdivicinus faecavium]